PFPARPPSDQGQAQAGNLPQQQDKYHGQGHSRAESRTDDARAVGGGVECAGHLRTSPRCREARPHSLRSSCQLRSSRTFTSKGEPSRVLREPFSCMIAAISCMRARSLSVSAALNTCVLIALVMISSRGTSLRSEERRVGKEGGRRLPAVR